MACLAGLLLPAAARAQPAGTGDVFPDFPVANGYYFSEAAGDDPGRGYTIANDGGIPFWDAFQRLGGVDALGYPSTGRFMWNGFLDQATQKVVLQWDPARQSVDVVNLFDRMEQLGLDDVLLAKMQIPPVFDNAADAGKPWPQVVARHQAELDWDPAIRARYFADPDPLAHFGLPQSYADEGDVRVVRCQRAVFQQWKQAVPWARAGDVTVANGGDIAKELNLLPAGAATPSSAAGLIVAPLNVAFSLTEQQVTAVRAAATAIQPSLVYIESDLGDGSVASGSGVIVDPSGLVVTDAHVVAGATRTVVQLADGRTLPAQIVGRDTLPDVAVLRVPATGLPAAQGAAPPPTGSVIVAVGFTDAFPAPPAVRAGTVVGIRREQLSAAAIDDVVADLFTYFGDSGGPVLDLQGHVVGLVDSGSEITVQGVPYLISFETGFASIQPIIHQIVTTGQGIVRPVPGFGGVAMTPELAGRFGLPKTVGILVLRVDPRSPADRAGLIAGDVITTMDGTPTPDVAAYGTVLGRHRPGDRIAITYVDPTGGLHQVTLTLAGV